METQPQNSRIEGEKKLMFLRNISIEPCIALFSLGFSVFGVQVATLYIQKTCKVGSFFFGNKTYSVEVREREGHKIILI